MELIKKIMSFKADSVDLEEGTFQGHASTFGNRDSDGDVIDKGAFNKTLGEHGDRVKILFEHYDLIGKPVEMKEDDHGLFVKGRISQTSLGKDVLTLMRDGVLNEMSIGFQIIKKAFDKATNTNHIKEVKLWEFSLVPWGANDQALVTGVKRMGLNNSQLVRFFKCDEGKEILRQALAKEPPQQQAQDPDAIQSLRKSMEELNKLLK